jgi:hypothetical protein
LFDPWKDSLDLIYSKHRAYSLWPKIYFMHKDNRVIVDELLLDEKLFEDNKNFPLLTDNVLNQSVKNIQVKPE